MLLVSLKISEPWLNLAVLIDELLIDYNEQGYITKPKCLQILHYTSYYGFSQTVRWRLIWLANLGSIILKIRYSLCWLGHILGYILKENLHQKSFLKLISLISLEKSQTYFIHKMHWWILCYLTMVQSILGKMPLGKKAPRKNAPCKIAPHEIFLWTFLMSSFFYENFVHKKNLFSFNEFFYYKFVYSICLHYFFLSVYFWFSGMGYNVYQHMCVTNSAGHCYLATRFFYKQRFFQLSLSVA